MKHHKGQKHFTAQHQKRGCEKSQRPLLTQLRHRGSSAMLTPATEQNSRLSSTLRSVLVLRVHACRGIDLDLHYDTVGQ